MNLKQTAKLIQLLKASGVTKFKSVDLELEFGNSPTSTSGMRKSISKPSKSQAASAQPPSPAGAASSLTPKDLPIPHHMTEVRSLLKLNDNDLVDKIFPEGPLPAHLRAE